jgi:flavin reductase (DIM6/NTAB) family NADH-FMN oxidoreductase RutF
MRRTLEATEALRLLDGGPVVLVTTRWRDQADVMPAIWTTPLSRTNHAQYFGVESGRDVKKLDISNLPTFKAAKVDAPLIEGCIAHIECALDDALRLGDHTLFVGRALVVQAEKDAFDETWLVEEPEYRPLHYLGLDRYAVLGERLRAELRTTDEGAVELAETADERERREEEEARERERVEREGEQG